jgi:protein-S-isoprenylcysteine O-methyltransferase Ste14
MEQHAEEMAGKPAGRNLGFLHLTRSGSGSTVRSKMEHMALKVSGSCWTIFYIYWLVSAFATKRTAAREPVMESAMYRIPLVAAVVILVWAWRMPEPMSARGIRPSFGVGLLAMALSLAGLCTCVWARVVLGRNWSSRVEVKVDHELVQAGPYRYVRHPIYTGMILMFSANVILVGRVGAILALFLFVYGFVLKLRREERTMTKQFPSSYPEYVKRTKLLVPFVV